jgi:hypothetical protein
LALPLKKTLWEVPVSTLENRIVKRLTTTFIVGGTVDAEALAADMQKEFPALSQSDLAKAIVTVANGIGVRVKGVSDEKPNIGEATCRPCT